MQRIHGWIGVGVALGLTVGCGSEVDVGQQTQAVFDVTPEIQQQLPDGELITVDLSQSDVAYRFSFVSGELAYDRIEIICPNGLTMRMDAWLEEQTPSLGVYLSEVDYALFMLSAFPIDDTESLALVNQAPQRPVLASEQPKPIIPPQNYCSGLGCSEFDCCTRTVCTRTVRRCGPPYFAHAAECRNVCTESELQGWCCYR